MAEEPQPRSEGLYGTVSQLGSRLISSLPAQFLVLCGLNVVFFYALFNFLDHQLSSRERLLGPVVAACIQTVPADFAKEMLNRIDHIK